MSLPIRNGPVSIADQLTPGGLLVNCRVAGWGDLACQWLYFLGYRVVRIWWFLRRPEHEGAIIALWHRRRLLLVRSSYRPGWELPGGGVDPGEAPEAAARRELEEELGIILPPGMLRCAGSDAGRFEHRRDRVTLFEAELEAPPEFRLDHREVVAAAFHDPASLDRAALNPYLRRYLERRQAGAAHTDFCRKSVHRS
jgi:8-oxo-dGTP pyrophosphatase MutT (NUDIX family)